MRSEADIAIGDQLFFRIRTSAAGFRVVERERIINERLVNIISDGAPAPVTISPIRGKPTIYVDGVQLVTVYPRDVEALLPLQIRYELEAVVINRQKHSEQVCRQNLKRTLRQQLVLLAEQNGKVVAKAGTNARGFHTDQIGGVFTVESKRNSGLAFRVMEELLRRIFSEKPTACLFVKKDNLPALSLYRKLGFRSAEGYQISYYKT